VLIPAPLAATVEVRFAPLADRDRFDPAAWRREPLARDPARVGWWALDVDALALPDGDYEYELLLDGDAKHPVADPWAEELVRFGGYRGLFRVRGGRRWRPPFRWDDELPAGTRLPENDEMVIYEMPLRWMAGGAGSAVSEDVRQVGLGTFERVLFDRLDELTDLGVNCIELLPVQDSADTLNWGYGSRFFFTTDVDMGDPVDLKLLVKRCHQRGIRVILDVVMNHARDCPLAPLADDWFFLPPGEAGRAEEPGRGDDYGARLFRYRRPAPDGSFPAREFHYALAEFWVREYHVDGFRIDEFRGIDHWEFVQAFRDRAWGAHRALFPDRPFLVIAEDSWRRTQIVHDDPANPNGRRVVDAMWNFSFRDESRRLLHDEIRTAWGRPPRRARVEALLSGRDTVGGDVFQRGFGDLAQAVNYVTSHDVEALGEQRFMNDALGRLLRERGLGDGSVESVRWVVDHLGGLHAGYEEAHADALDRARSAFALLLTAVGIPMFLAGEEFADVHDLAHGDWRLKMSDPVDWRRREQPGHDAMRSAVRELVRLRTSHPALQRNEVECFHFHPAFDENAGTRVFAYCRTDGRPTGEGGQVVVVANAGARDFAEYVIPWPWAGHPSVRVHEHGAPLTGAPLHVGVQDARAALSLAGFQVRVFAT
jgi:1,4-alpha-glucan branching enzyme